MKNLITILISFFLINTAFAGMTERVILFNLSQKYDMEITYRVCTYTYSATGQNPTCEDDVETSIKAKQYVILTQTTPPPPDAAEIDVYLVSAVEKDTSGNILAQGTFFAGSYNQECSGRIYYSGDGTTGIDVTLKLDDMYESPFLSCTYNYSYRSIAAK